MSDGVMRISTVQELRRWVRQLEARRVETFSFLPCGQLAARYPKGNVGKLVMELMTLVRAVETTLVTQGNALVEVRCKVGYHACVTMLDAWRTRRISQLTKEQQQALQTADSLVRTIIARRRETMGRLHMLYSYIGSAIDYKMGDENTQEFSLLTDAAWTLLRKVGNCQGFAGVMYLCGGMMGFRVGLQSGRSRAGGHMWNIIEVGTKYYAMDCSAAAVARSESRRLVTDYASFVMGKLEAAENGLTWTAEMETHSIEASLDPAHDYYHASGTSFTSAEEAAREIWKRRLAGEKEIHVRIRGRRATSLDDLSRAMQAVGDEPAINREIGRKLGGSTSYGLCASTAGLALYASVEWQKG